MSRLLPILSFMLLTQNGYGQNSNYDLIDCERVNHFLKVKSSVAERVWPDFRRDLLFGPIFLFSPGGKYVVNPNERLKSRITFNEFECKNAGIEMGKISSDVDSSRFYMYVAYDDKDTSVLYYRNSIAHFSSIELTQKFIPSVTHTDEWTAMVVHEIFHQYQRTFPAFSQMQESSHKDFSRDTLIYFYDSLDWFRRGIESENELLLGIIDTSDDQFIRDQVQEYLSLKEKRRNRIMNEYKIDIAELEDNLEITEGIARYVEFQTKLIFKEMKENRDLAQVDDLYNPAKFADYTLENDEWMYRLWGFYCYTTGFNLTRVLDKLSINYKSEIYEKGRSFNYYLEDFI
jgi:hypothetical protein